MLDIDPTPSRFAIARATPKLAVLLAVVLAVAACGSSQDQKTGEIAQPVGTGQPELHTPIPIGRSPTPTVAPTNTPAPFDQTWRPAQTEAANRLIDAEEGVFGVVIMDEAGNVLFSRNSTAPFVTASLYKLVVMADILKRLELGELDLDEPIYLEPEVFLDGIGGDTYFLSSDVSGTSTIREMLLAVGAYSSNVSARTLLTFTDTDSLNETAREIGMENTWILTPFESIESWPPQPGPDSSQAETDLAARFVEDLVQDDGIVSLTTSMDMATYQLGLARGTTISPWVSEQILAICFEQQIRDRIPYLLDGRFTVSNKPGNLIRVVNDVGVIFTPGEPRVVSVLSEALIWDGRAHEVIQRLALIATGETTVPPISEESMMEGGGVPVVFGAAPDPRTIIDDPPPRPDSS
ncbi:hypothetical protein BH23CHL5_BH23CHL5_25280 [soil metagenome]